MTIDLIGHDDPAAKLHTLGTILLVHATVEAWHWAWALGKPTAVIAFAAVYTALLVLGLDSRHRRLALALLTATLVIQCWWTFPFVANHTFLRLICGFFLAFLDSRQLAERRLSQTAIGWTTIVVLFYTGFQKLLYGTYFEGQYLSYLIGLSDRFRIAFGWLIPAVELGRLQSIGTPIPGSGPYTVDSPPFLVLANLVYVAEIGLAIGLIWRGTRRVAIYLTLAMLLVIEIGARELFFGVLFCNLVVMLHPNDLIRRLVPVSLMAYVLALLWELAGFGGFLT